MASNNKYKPTVFIGSSSERLPFAKKVAEWLRAAGCVPKLWSETFKAGDITVQKLIDSAAEADGAIFVFSEDDKTWFRNKKLVAPRDNVVYELGLFMGSAIDSKLKRVVFCRLGDCKVANDLSGVTFIGVNPKRQAASHKEVKEWGKSLTSLPSRAVAVSHDRFESTPKKKLFEVGTRLISEARESISLSAKTPVPIMGPRPYGSARRFVAHENEQYKAYWRIAEKASKGIIEFTLISSMSCIHAEITQSKNESFRKKVRENVERLFQLSAMPGSKLDLYWYEGLSMPAFVVADEKSLLWWKGEDGECVSITDGSSGLAGALTTVNTAVFAKQSKQFVLKRING